MRRATECKSCKAKIFFAVTLNGREIPVDYEPVENGNLEITLPPDPRDMPTAFVLRRDDKALTPTRYVSHFATCPDADEHRRANPS